MPLGDPLLPSMLRCALLTSILFTATRQQEPLTLKMALIAANAGGSSEDLTASMRQGDRRTGSGIMRIEIVACPARMKPLSAHRAGHHGPDRQTGTPTNCIIFPWDFPPQRPHHFHGWRLHSLFHRRPTYRAVGPLQ